MHYSGDPRSFRILDPFGGCGTATELLEPIRRRGSGIADGDTRPTRSHYHAQPRSGEQQTRFGSGFEPWIQWLASGKTFDGTGGSELRRRAWPTTSFRATLN